MVLTVDFDLMVCLFALAIFIIGYFSGATVEIVRLFHLIVPFVLISLFGESISRIILQSGMVHGLFSRYKVLTVIPYIHTFIIVLILLFTYLILYYLLALVLNQVRKIVASELVKFKLGHINHVFGGIISLFRVYILLSVFILPFIVFGFTSKKDDVSTRIILSYSPSFIQTTTLVNQSSHLTTTIEHYTSLLEMINLIDLTEELNKLEVQLAEDRKELVMHSQKLMNHSELPLDQPLTLSIQFIDKPDSFLKQTKNSDTQESLRELYDRMIPHRGLIYWMDKHNTPNLSQEERLARFIEDYDQIKTDTYDSSTLIKLYRYESKVYVYQWLTQTLDIMIDDVYQIFQDDVFSKIIDQLLIELDSGGLIDTLKTIQDTEELKKVNNMELFLKYYKDHQPRVDIPNLDSLPLVYQIIAELIINRDWRTELVSPLEAMYRVDTLIELNRKSFYFPDDTFYQTLIKIYIPVYFISYSSEGEIVTVDHTKMKEALETINQAIDRVQAHELFIKELFIAFVDSNIYDPIKKESIPYIQYLIEYEYFTLNAFEVLMASSYISESHHEKLTVLIEELREVYE